MRRRSRSRTSTTRWRARRSVALAVRQGNLDTAVPRLLAMLCILAVFIPSFFMQGAAQALFVPLSLAVGFAMIASYLLSSTFVPVALGLAAPPRRTDRHRRGRRSAFDRIRRRLRPGCLAWSSAGAGWSCRPTWPSRRWSVVGVGPGSAWRSSPGSTPAGSSSGSRPRPGTRIEETEKIAIAALERSAEEVGHGERRDLAGLRRPDPVELPDQRHLPVDGRPRGGHAPRGPEGGSDASAVEAPQGAAPGRARGADARASRFSFEPADIVSEVMSFGSPTPVEVAVSGPNLADNRAYAEKLREGAGEGPLAPRPPVRPVAGLPDGRRRDRPREGRAERRDRARRSPARSWRPPRRAGSWCRTTGPTPRPGSATRCRSRSPTR